MVCSTSVPMALLLAVPQIRSPSQWPGTARSATSARRSLIMTIGSRKRSRRHSPSLLCSCPISFRQSDLWVFPMFTSCLSGVRVWGRHRTAGPVYSRVATVFRRLVPALSGGKEHGDTDAHIARYQNEGQAGDAACADSARARRGPRDGGQVRRNRGLFAPAGFRSSSWREDRAYAHVVDGWHEADRSMPRKQRHTARRVHKRLRDEFGLDGSYACVQRYVHEWRRSHREPDTGFLRLRWDPGVMQVDFGVVGPRSRAWRGTCISWCVQCRIRI